MGEVRPVDENALDEATTTPMPVVVVRRAEAPLEAALLPEVVGEPTARGEHLIGVGRPKARCPDVELDLVELPARDLRDLRRRGDDLAALVLDNLARASPMRSLVSFWLLAAVESMY